jgi:hypothetical protein
VATPSHRDRVGRRSTHAAWSAALARVGAHHLAAFPAGILLGFAIWTFFVLGRTDGADIQLPASGSSGSVPLVLLGLAIGTLGLLILNPMPRPDRRRDED